MILRFITDFHAGGKNALGTFDDLCYVLKESSHPCVYLGDNVEVINSYKKDTVRAREQLLLIRNYFLSRKMPFVLGNHEGDAVLASNFAYIDEERTILVTHSDIWQWGAVKAFAFRNKTQGVGWFKYNVLVPVVDNARHLLTVRPNENLITEIRREKQKNPNLKVLFMGHSHPDENVIFWVDGVLCVILKRGVHDIDVKAFMESGNLFAVQKP